MYLYSPTGLVFTSVEPKATITATPNAFRCDKVGLAEQSRRLQAPRVRLRDPGSVRLPRDGDIKRIRAAQIEAWFNTDPNGGNTVTVHAFPPR